MSREQFLILIGQATISFSHLDNSLTGLICRSIKKEKSFGYKRMGFGRKIMFLEKLSISEMLYAEIFPLLKGLIPNLHAINEERVRIVHNVWYLHESEDIAINHNIGFSKEVNVSSDYYTWTEIKTNDLINHIRMITSLDFEISKIFRDCPEFCVNLR